MSADFEKPLNKIRTIENHMGAVLEAIHQPQIALEQIRTEFQALATKPKPVNSISGEEEKRVHERELQDAAEGKEYIEEF